MARGERRGRRAHRERERPLLPHVHGLDGLERLAGHVLVDLVDLVLDADQDCVGLEAIIPRRLAALRNLRDLDLERYILRHVACERR